MNVGRYRLLAQLGAGRDGVSYRARPHDADTLVEVKVLSAARADADRWRWLTRRLQLAALLRHPAALRVEELGLEHDPPYAALEWAAGENLGTDLRGRLPLSVAAAAALAADLASALAASHHFGLAHGRLSPNTIRITPTRDLKIDFTGSETQDVAEPEPLREIDACCRAPEPDCGGVLACAADVYSLGALLWWFLTGQTPCNVRPGGPAQPGSHGAAAFARLVQAMRAVEPAERPSAQEVERLLRAVRAHPEASQLAQTSAALAVADSAGSNVLTCFVPPSAVVAGERPERTRLLEQSGQTEPLSAEPPAREHLGRFRLLDRLGQGGMGAVYRAEDPADGSVVAIKVLRADLAGRTEALQRFHKEARLLAEVNNPYVTNLLEVNEDQGVHYLVLELVTGTDLGQHLAQGGRLDEARALAIMADVARALVDAHRQGIVHRDVKPENILLVRAEPEAALASSAPSVPLVKLSDFGLARHIVETESLNLTQAGALVGTPLYMAPEQCSGGPIDPRTDVYAMGATLFHLLAGRPPFQASSPLAVLAMHRHDPPPDLHHLNPQVSAAACQVVARALAKSPEARPRDAAALLRDLERLLRGEPSDVAVHPRLPACAPRHVVQYEWDWQLEASPAQLWPHVSNTERLNRAAGLPPVQFSVRPAEEGDAPEESPSSPRVKRFAAARKLGLTLAWEEHPFEWIEGQRLGVLREFSRGPFKWLVSTTELMPRATGGTLLRHRVRVEPRGLLGRTAAAVEIGLKARRGLDRVYRRIDAVLTGKLGQPALVDPFEEPAALSGARRQRLEGLLERLSACRVEPAVVERLGDFLAHAPDQEVARIRPLALARGLGLDPDQVVAACLHGAREGLLLLFWDILCPVCRVPAQVQDTLRAIRAHGRCDACQLDFELDFANSVELIFRAHPEVRATELRTYCIGGPGHSPHVAAQVRVGAGERLELELALAEGAYQLRGPQLPYALAFRVEPAAPVGRWDLCLSGGRPPEWPRALRTGAQVLVLTNACRHELVVRVERTASRFDALTAARAASLALFRTLFPGEALSPGQLISVSTVTLLVTALDGAGRLYQELGDARAFALVHEQFRLLDERIGRAGGALVKTVGEGVVAVFSEAAAAVQVGLDLQGLLERTEATHDLRLRVGIHRGPAIAATLNDRLDYFGTTVSQAVQLPQLAGGGELLLTQAVAADPRVAALLKARGLEGKLEQVHLAGQPGSLVQRFAISRSRPVIF